MIILVLILVISLLLILASRVNQQITPKRTLKQQQTDELITVILPNITKE
jgi:hypothetical protein